MGSCNPRLASGDVLQGAAADCNSAGETHAWFDSRVAHHFQKFFREINGVVVPRQVAWTMPLAWDMCMFPSFIIRPWTRSGGFLNAGCNRLSVRGVS